MACITKPFASTVYEGFVLVRTREPTGHGLPGAPRTRADTSDVNARDPVRRSNPGTSLVLPAPPRAFTPRRTKDLHGCGDRRAGDPARHGVSCWDAHDHAMAAA